MISSSGTARHRKRLTIRVVDLSPETNRRCASAVLMTKYRRAHGHILDNRFAVKAQQYLELLLSAASCPVPLTHLCFIRPANIGLIHLQNDKLYIPGSEIFGGLVEWHPLPRPGL
jgi:hypothetical protein